MLTGDRLQLSTIGNFLDADTPKSCWRASRSRRFLLLGRVYWKTPFATPALLLASILLFYVALLLLGVPLADVQARAGCSGAGVRAFAPPWTLEFPRFPWSALPELGADFFAVMFVTTVCVLLNITGIELATKREANLDRELNVLGVANLLCAALGGYVACITVTRTNMNFALGRSSRVAGLLIAAMSAAALLVNPDFIAYMPKCVLGGLLLTIGLDLLRRWLIGTARQLARLEYLSLLAIAFIIVRWGFVAGVSIGVIIGCATFALSAGRVNAIKFAFDGTEYRSSLDRGPRELALLGANGQELQGLFLQSYLFFGPPTDSTSTSRRCWRRPQCRFLLFDFKLVTGIDSSATHSFSQIKQAADALGARLVLVNLSPAITKAFNNIKFISSDVLVIPELDRALESCENEIILAHSDAEGETRSLRDWLAEVLGNAEHGELLAAQCQRFEFEAGEIIAHQGAPADSMHFILEGRVGIIVNLEGGRAVRVRSLGRHTTIGEMGLITGRPRSATVQAEIACVAYELRAEAFEALKAERPVLAQALFTFVIGVMAERLSFASKVIGVLQR